ncbi:ABC transporter substrate-binding protein [Neobacillus drentensis]|uniref:ABC transporter substrate-binding protein n=1 Tax=Neobacillus drentensis TaxID=220684 RepID=UPI0030009A94
MKKRLMSSFLVTLLVSAAVLVGCSKDSNDQKASSSNGNEDNSNQQVAIDFWGGWTGPDGDVMRSMVDQFNSENPNIKVTLTTLQWTPLFEKFVTQVKAGNPPSLMAMHPQDIASFASLGILDGEAAKNAEVKKEDFAPNVWKQTFLDGKQFAIPLDNSTHGLYLNTEMFTKAGLDATKPPKTAAEFIDAATKLTIDANGKHPNEAGFDSNNVKQYGFGMPNNHHGFYMWLALMGQQGESLLNKDQKKIAVDSAKGADAWKFLEELIYKYKVVPKGQKDPMGDFKAGLTAMVIDGPWQLPGLETQDKIKWATAPFFQVYDEPGVWGSGHILTFPVEKDAKKREAALKLAKWLSDHSEDWAKSGNIPTKLAVQDKIKDMPGRQAFIDSIPNVKMLPNIAKTQQLFSAVAPSPIITATQSIMLENKKPEDVMKDMTDGMNAILSQP